MVNVRVRMRNGDILTVRDVDAARVKDNGTLRLFSRDGAVEQIEVVRLWGLRRTTQTVDRRCWRTVAAFASGQWVSCWVEGRIEKLHSAEDELDVAH